MRNHGHLVTRGRSGRVHSRFTSTNGPSAMFTLQVPHRPLRLGLNPQRPCARHRFVCFRPSSAFLSRVPSSRRLRPSLGPPGWKFSDPLFLLGRIFYSLSSLSRLLLVGRRSVFRFLVFQALTVSTVPNFLDFFRTITHSMSQPSEVSVR